jgi:hypothetical protein
MLDVVYCEWFDLGINYRKLKNKFQYWLILRFNGMITYICLQYIECAHHFNHFWHKIIQFHGMTTKIAVSSKGTQLGPYS